MFRTTYENTASVPIDVVRGWMQPVFGTKETAHRFQRWIAGMNDRELVAIEPELRKLQVPTLLVWGTGDAFFKMRHAEQLRDTIAGADEIVEVPGGKLFFADERAEEFAVPVRRHWLAHAPLAPAS
jgi:pimeloyl-ACP methyl ester carboxylesterase